jgi:hypothetical protein
MPEITENTANWVTHKSVGEQLSDLYKIVMHEKVLLTYVFQALERLSFLATEKKFESFLIQDYVVKVPCNAFEIVSVTTLESLSKDVPTDTLGYVYNKNVVDMPYGRFIPYVLQGEEMKFNQTGFHVFIEYKRIKSDDEGNIMFPEYLLTAVLNYVLMAEFKARWITKEGTYDEYRAMELEWNKERNRAKRGTLNRNEIHEVLQLMFSFNRNKYFY